MNLSPEKIITIVSSATALLVLLFAVEWRYFRDWVVVFLYKSVLDAFWGIPVVNLHLLEYPYRLLPHLFKTNILFEFWIFPVLCVWYNHVTRERNIWPIIYYAVLFSAAMTAIEYHLELYTNMIKYIKWSWFATFCTLTVTFLSSRAFMAFYRWGCVYFGQG